MRTHITRRTIPWALTAALLLAAGCGDDDANAGAPADDDAASAETTAADSPYCDVAISWAVHEMTPFDDTDPVAFEKYWSEHTAFEEDALATTPGGRILLAATDVSPGDTVLVRLSRGRLRTTVTGRDEEGS